MQVEAGESKLLLFQNLFLSLFLAAISSSRSDVVTQCVRPSFRPFFFLLVFPLVLKSFGGVSRLFKGCLKFKGGFKDVSRMF